MPQPPPRVPSGLSAPALSPAAGLPWRVPAVPGWPWWRAGLATWWVLGAVISTITAPLPPCREVACTVDWGFAALLPVGLLSVGLLWWRPLVALACGVIFGAAEVALDPETVPRVWFGVHAVLCLVLAGRLLWLRRLRARALRRESVPVTVPGWVRTAAVRGPVPVQLGERLWPGILAAGAGVAVLVVLGFDVMALREHRANAEQVTAVVTEVETPWYPTLQIEDPAGGVRTVQLETLDGFTPGDRVAVWLDRSAQPLWVELVDEPADPSWQLPLAVVLAIPGGLQIVSALTAARTRRRLLTGTHPGVRVLAARQLDGPPGTESSIAVATLTDRMVLAHTRPDLVLVRPGSPDPGGRGRTMPARPVLGTLYGQLREGGYATFLADDTVALPDTPLRAVERTDLTVPELEVTDEVTSVAGAGPDDATLAWALGRRAFRDLTPAQPATSLPTLPWSPVAATLDVASGLALLLMSVLTWPVVVLVPPAGMPLALTVALPLAVAALCVTAAAPRLARSFVVNEHGLTVEGTTLPWSWVRMTASGRGRVHLVVGRPPEDLAAASTYDDLRLVRSRPLREDEATRCAAVVETLRRRPSPAVTMSARTAVDPVRRLVVPGLVLHVIVAVAVAVLSR